MLLGDVVQVPGGNMRVMRAFTGALFLSLAALALLAPFAQVSATDKSHLICRGGGQSSMSAWASTGSIGSTLEIDRSKAAATMGLNPGECAWQDAGMDVGDPTLITAKPTNINMDVGPGATVYPNGGINGTLYEYQGTPFLDFIKDANAYYSFNVERDPSNTWTLKGFNKVADPKSPVLHVPHPVTFPKQ
jgi:hypothetical protein